MRLVLSIFLFLGIALAAGDKVIPQGMNPAAPPETAQLAFTLGNWDLVSKSLQADGGYRTTSATSTTYFILDGFAIQDDFRALDPSGRVVFRGTSIRTFDPRTKKWSIKWLMAGESGMTLITGELKDGQFVMEGKGSDGGGEFMERATYLNISADHYSFKMSRSFDGGKTWIENFNLIEATRAK